MITFYTVNDSQELDKVQKTDGNIIFNLGTNEIFVDIGTERKSYGIATKASEISIVSDYGDNVQEALNGMEEEYTKTSAGFNASYNSANSNYLSSMEKYNELKQNMVSCSFNQNTRTLTLSRGY